MILKHELLPKRDKGWDEVARELFEAKMYLKQYEQMVDELSAKLKTLSNQESSRGNGYLYIKQYREGSYDYPRLLHYLVDVEGIEKSRIETFRKERIAIWKITKI